MPSHNWFRDLFGIDEDFNTVHQHLSYENGILSFQHHRYKVGNFEMKSLAEFPPISPNNIKSTIDIVYGDVSLLMADPANNGAVFQVASQFNCLEFVNPRVTPEHGVTIYSKDKTQGPACSIACGPATVFRNYFVEMKRQDGQQQVGQTSNWQLNGLEDIERDLGINTVKNGYFIATEEQLVQINSKLNHLDPNELGNKLKVGIQWNTPVTSTAMGAHRVNHEQYVTQVFASSFAMGYTNVDLKYWQPLTRIVLKSTYKLAFQTALKSKQPKLYLTLVGGGVFKNPLEWILDAIQNSLEEFQHYGLQVFIVLYQENQRVLDFVNKLNHY